MSLHNLSLCASEVLCAVNLDFLIEQVFILNAVTISSDVSEAITQN